MTALERCLGGHRRRESGDFIRAASAVATFKGYKVSHDGLSIVYPGATFTDADQLQVASAGFQAQWVMAELALRDHDGNETKPGNFGAGVVCAHLGITLAYLTVLKDRPTGDVVGIAEATQGSHNNIALALAVPGALDDVIIDSPVPVVIDIEGAIVRAKSISSSTGATLRVPGDGIGTLDGVVLNLDARLEAGAHLQVLNGLEVGLIRQ